MRSRWLLRRLQHGALAQAGHGRHPGDAQGGDQRREHREQHAEHQRHDDRAGGDHGALVGQVDLERLEQRVDGRREADARRPGRAPRPAARCRNASRITERRSWRRLAPSVRSIAELARALGDGDREGVEDQEGAPRTANAREDQQRRLRMPMNSPTSSFCDSVFSLAGLDLHRARQRLAQRALAAPPGVTPSAAATLIWSNLPCLRGDPLGLGQREHGDARRRRRSRRRRAWRCPRARSRVPTPCPRPDPVARPRSRRGRRSACRSPPRSSAWLAALRVDRAASKGSGSGRGAEGGRAVAADRLAVLVEDRDLRSKIAARRPPPTPSRARTSSRRCRERRLAAVVGLDRLARGDHGVDARRSPPRRSCRRTGRSCR